MSNSNSNSDNDNDESMNDTTNITIKKKQPHPNGIAVLFYIQQKVKEMKIQNPTHRTAVALVSEEYRKQNSTVRKIKNSTKCKKCKKCKNK